ncbi:MAG: IS3 family transposase, partial [Planctomycetota bacterium]|nr:IS3 family transposase [Planctomycetota bacterium]
RGAAWGCEAKRALRRRRKRARIARSGNSCTRRRAEAKDHVWTYDFPFERTEDGRRLKVLVLVDECTRDCLCMHVARSIPAQGVFGLLA